MTNTSRSRLILSSGARTTTQTSSDRDSLQFRGLHLIIDVTVNGAGGSITPKIQGKTANGVYYDILVGTALVATGTVVLKVYPGIASSPNASASDVLPRHYRVIITANNANSVTYSVAENLVY